MSSEIFPVLAHYGGIDEVGVFVVPIVAAVLLLRWAERRALDKAGGPGDEIAERHEASGVADPPKPAPVPAPESTKLAADE